MNVERLNTGVKRKIGVLMRERHPSPGVVVDIPDFEAQRDRLLDVQKRLGLYRSWQSARKRRIESLERLKATTATALHAIQNRKTIMAFDVERKEGVIIEVGVTLLVGLQLTTCNLRVAGNTFYSSYDHGDSIEFETLQDLHVMLSTMADAADFYLGHSLVNDFDALRDNDMRIAKKEFFDTIHFTRHNPAFPDDGAPKLVELAAHYGIPNPHPHNGGNDSRTTALVFLALLDDAEKPASLS